MNSIHMEISYCGFKFHISGPSIKDHITKTIHESNCFYEIALLEYIKNLGITGDFAIDVGANIGNHSLFFGKFIAQSIISVEPNIDLIPILEDNLRTNGINFKIISCAAGKENGYGELYFPLKDNIGAGKITQGKGSIPIKTIDNIAPDSGVCLVKIDVEGMEIDALKGATNLLKKQHPHIIVEAATRKSLDKINEFLKQFEYKCISKWNATPTYHFAHKPSAIYRLRAKWLQMTNKFAR